MLADTLQGRGPWKTLTQRVARGEPDLEERRTETGKGLPTQQFLDIKDQERGEAAEAVNPGPPFPHVDFPSQQLS